MSLRLVKIEEGINEGEVLYHAHVAKSSKEIAQLRQMAPRIKFVFTNISSFDLMELLGSQ
jgi:hypothetical protein